MKEPKYGLKIAFSGRFQSPAISTKTTLVYCKIYSQDRNVTENIRVKFQYKKPNSFRENCERIQKWVKIGFFGRFQRPAISAKMTLVNCNIHSRDRNVTENIRVKFQYKNLSSFRENCEKPQNWAKTGFLGDFKVPPFPRK